MSRGGGGKREEPKVRNGALWTGWSLATLPTPCQAQGSFQPSQGTALASNQGDGGAGRGCSHLAPLSVARARYFLGVPWAWQGMAVPQREAASRGRLALNRGQHRPPSGQEGKRVGHGAPCLDGGGRVLSLARSKAASPRPLFLLCGSWQQPRRGWQGSAELFRLAGGRPAAQIHLHCPNGLQ